MKAIELKPFDAAEFLDNEEVIAEYLRAAAKDPDCRVLQMALHDVERARTRNGGSQT